MTACTLPITADHLPTASPPTTSAQPSLSLHRHHLQPRQSLLDAQTCTWSHTSNSASPNLLVPQMRDYKTQLQAFVFWFRDFFFFGWCVGFFFPPLRAEPNSGLIIRSNYQSLVFLSPKAVSVRWYGCPFKEKAQRHHILINK